MSDSENKSLPGICPVCRSRITAEPQIMGMWDGCKPSGVAAGGGYFETTCQGCGTALMAFEDLYDEAGNLPGAVEDSQPELYWERKREW
jgi:hypothetical protein